MENRYYKNKLTYILVVIVTVIVYLVIHLYCDGLRKDIYKEDSEYQNSLNKQPINNITTTKKEKEEKIPVDNIKLSTSKVTLKTGGKTRIIAIIEPYNATERGLVWTSSDPSIATVDSYGNIVGLKEGEVTITVRTKDGKVKATCTIKIEPKKVNEIKLYPKDMSLKINSSAYITAVTKPDSLSNNELTWESSDPSVAKVDSNGKVTGLKEGTATITAKTKDGKVVAICTVNITSDSIPVSKIKLDHDKVSVKVGSSSQLITTIEPKNATERDLVWESSDPSVAIVDANGKITGVKPGTTTITVKTKDGKVTATCTVTVDPIPVDKIILNTNKMKLDVGDSEKLEAIIDPSDATDQELIWTSSNPKVATVDSNGKVTGVGAGEAIITVKTKDGKVKEQCKVTVTVPVSDIELDNDKTTVKVGSSEQLNVTIKPENATDKELIWESSDPSVVTVDSNGKITGVKPGTATITVKTKDGEVKDTCTVTVVDKDIPISGITFDNDKTTVKVGDKEQLKVTIEPENATEKDLIWESSDPSVVTVDSNGKITGVKPGTATITVKTKDGEIKDTCTVTVVAEDIPVSKITLDHNNVSVKVGDKEQLTATVEPANATDKELVWESSDPTVASVDSNGKITGLKPGTTTITVKTKDGKVKATCTVTVEEDELPEDVVFTYDYDDDNYIYLINQFPITDEVGKNLQGVKHTQDFKLRFNAQAVGVQYTITVEKYDESNLDDEWAKQFLVNDGTDVANCYRANNRVKTFDEYEMYNSNPKERILYEGTITSAEAARGYKDFTYRMWVSEDLQLNNSDYLSQNRTFKTRINVYAHKN